MKQKTHLFSSTLKSMAFALFLCLVSLRFVAAENGSGFFIDSGQNLGSLLGSLYSWTIALGDLDGDGDLDAFIANEGANEVCLNAGNGYFVNTNQAIGNSWSTAVVLGDLDGDGDLDAFVANSQSQPNTIWLNNGAGYFIDSMQRLGSSASYGAALGDLDGDGDLDAFVTNNLANKVWLNDSSGHFTDSGQSLGNLESIGVALADLDNDGDLDAFVGNEEAGSGGQPNKVYLNNGSGIFTDSGQNLGSERTQGVALGDIDGDGDIDAFVANEYDLNANKVYLNNGSALFSDSGQNIGNSNSVDVALGDIDGDGDLDAFEANRDNQANKVYFNNGTGIFTDSGQNLGSSTSASVALGDIDGDSDLDAIIGNLGINKVWFNSDEPLNQFPVSNCGEDQVVFDEVALDGSGSYDPDGSIVSYYWNLNHTNSANNRTSEKVSPTISGLAPGFYNACLTVTDNLDATDMDCCLLAAAGSCSCTPTHNKENGPRCRDGLDNDCDGMIDSEDLDCQ